MAIFVVMILGEDGRMGKMYLVVPGEVISKTDGQTHFISADKLIHLYKVNKRDCVVLSSKSIAINSYPDLIKLTPREDGNYELPINSVKFMRNI
jgi:hypothetical protein